MLIKKLDLAERKSSIFQVAPWILFLAYDLAARLLQIDFCTVVTKCRILDDLMVKMLRLDDLKVQNTTIKKKDSIHYT